MQVAVPQLHPQRHQVEHAQTARHAMPGDVAVDPAETADEKPAEEGHFLLHECTGSRVGAGYASAGAVTLAGAFTASLRCTSWYRTGMNTSVKTIEHRIPSEMTAPSGAHMADPERIMGKTPTAAATLVRKIGLSLRFPAS